QEPPQSTSDSSPLRMPSPQRSAHPAAPSGHRGASSLQAARLSETMAAQQRMRGTSIPPYSDCHWLINNLAARASRNVRLSGRDGGGLAEGPVPPVRRGRDHRWGLAPPAVRGDYQRPPPPPPPPRPPRRSPPPPPPPPPPPRFGRS